VVVGVAAVVVVSGLLVVTGVGVVPGIVFAVVAVAVAVGRLSPVGSGPSFPFPGEGAVAVVESGSGPLVPPPPPPLLLLLPVSALLPWLVVDSIVSVPILMMIIMITRRRRRRLLLVGLWVDGFTDSFHKCLVMIAGYGIWCKYQQWRIPGK
jgi:hypothetical protein